MPRARNWLQIDKCYEYLQAQAGNEITFQELLDFTGWAEGTLEINISKKIREFLVDLYEPGIPKRDRKYYVNRNILNVDIDTFQVSAIFDVPADTSATAWNIGFTFRSSPEGPLRISIDSLGNWYFVVGNASPAQTGTVADVVTTAGGTNQLDLFVAEDRAVLGLNGQFAAVVDLPADSTAGDVRGNG